jgi:tetratricopeptide (TPR) repeat protein
MRSTPSRCAAAVLPLVLLFALTAALPAAAQNLTLPRVSPHATVTQTVGLTEITVDYHRPSVGGRELWGGLVPYGEVWRAGANENTTVTFSHPVAIEGEALAAGTYGLHMVPGESEWQVAFSRAHRSWGSFTYDAAEDALRVRVSPQPAPFFAEQLRYEFADVTRDGATLALHWGDLRVPLAVTTDTPAVVLAGLEDELRGVAQFNAQSWQQAAFWTFQNEVDDEQALAWIDRSVTLQPGLLNLNIKARILDRMGRDEEKAAAIAQADALAANENDVNLLGYTFLQTGDVERAVATFERNVREHPESWNVYDSLGEGYAAAGRTADAIEQYSKALEMAPEAQHGRIRGILDRLRGGAASR